MSRPRVYADAATKQRAYRDRLKARRRARQGPTNADLAGAVRDLHIRLEYVAATRPPGTVSALVGKDALDTLRNVVARLYAAERI
jgi:hypothetical protein